MYWTAGYLSYTFLLIKIELKIIKAVVYSDFRRTADASIYSSMSGKLAHQYYNIFLPRNSYFFLYFITKSY